jgi:hypothetical protein
MATYTAQATDTLLTFICNERALYSDLCALVRANDRTGYEALCERAMLAQTKAVAEWMDDPECDLFEYLTDPAEVDWNAIWAHFEQELWGPGR